MARGAHLTSDGDVEFALDRAVLLNLGTVQEALVIRGDADASANGAASSPSSSLVFTGGDGRFLRELERLRQPVRSLGKQLLTGVHTHHRGDLKYHERSRKFVESPRNFWTVIVQTQKQNFRITVYGKPGEFRRWADKIEIQSDMGSYSALLLNKNAELDTVLEIINHAAHLKKRRSGQ